MVKDIYVFTVLSQKRHCQDNLQKMAFNWAYIFRELESMMAQQRPGGRNS